MPATVAVACEVPLLFAILSPGCAWKSFEVASQARMFVSMLSPESEIVGFAGGVKGLGVGTIGGSVTGAGAGPGAGACLAACGLGVPQPAINASDKPDTAAATSLRFTESMIDL